MSQFENAVAHLSGVSYQPRVLPRVSIVLSVLGLLACGEFRNVGLLDAVSANKDKDNPSVACGDIETLNVAVPQSLVLGRGRPTVVWLNGSTGSGAAVVWSASNLPKGVELTDSTGIIAGTPSDSGTYTATVTATSASCDSVSTTRAVNIDVVSFCSLEDCPESPDCSGLRHESTALRVEYVPDQGPTREIGPSETLARDDLLVDAVILNPPENAFSRTLVLSVLNSKDVVLVHFTLPGGVFVPVTGQRIDLRYVRGEHDDGYLFLTIEHLKRFTLYHNGILTRDELQRRCPDNPIGRHCQLPEIDWVPLDCSHPTVMGAHSLALETVTAADEGPNVVRRRVGSGSGLVTGGMLLMLVNSVGCEGASCGDSPSPVRASYYEIPSECAVCRISRLEAEPLFAPATELELRGDVLHPQNATGATFTWTAEPPVTPGVLVRETNDDVVKLNFPMVGSHTVRLGCTAKNTKASLNSCGPSEVRLAVKQRADRPVRVEFWWLVPTVDEDPEAPPQLTFNGDAAQEQGPQFQVVEPSSFGGLQVRYPAGDGPSVQVWVRVLVDGVEESLWNETLEPGDLRDLGELSPAGLSGVEP